MSRQIMEQNLTRLLRQVEYKSCGSEPEPFQLTDQNGDGSIQYQKQSARDQFVNPFNKKLFRDRRLRRSSMYSSVEATRPMVSKNNNRSMAFLLNEHKQHSFVEKTTQEQMQTIFYKSLNILQIIRKKVIKENKQFRDSKQILKNSQQNIVQKFKQHLEYINQYLLYHYPLEDDELISINKIQPTEKTQQDDKTNQHSNNDQYICDMHGYSVHSDFKNDHNQENQGFRSNYPHNYQVNIEERVCVPLNEKNQNIIRFTPSLNTKPKTKRKSQAVTSLSGYTAKSIYESVLEERKNKKSKKSKLT